MEKKISLTKSFGVYAIECRINSKVYVGSTTKSFSARWKQWKDNLRRQQANRHIQNAWNKYGEENFEFFVLEVVEDVNKILEREQYWIEGLDVRNPEKGYNFMSALKAGKNDVPLTAEQLAELKGKTAWSRDKNKKYKLALTPEQRQAKSEGFKGANNPNFGRDFSPEHRRKISEVQRKFTPEVEEQIYQEYIAGNSTRTLSKKYETCTDVIVRVVLHALKEQGHVYSSLDDAVKAGALPRRRIKFQNPEARKEKIRAAGRFDSKYSAHDSQQIFEKFMAGVVVTKLAQEYGGHTDTIRASIRRSFSEHGLDSTKLRRARAEYGKVLQLA